MTGFSKDDMKNVTSFLELSCIQGTWDQYEKHWKGWVAYLQTVKGPGFANPRLEEMDHYDKVIRMVLFIKHLYDSGLRKQRVLAAIAAISAKMQLLACDTSLFKDAIIVRAKNGTVGTNEELEEANSKKLRNPTVPMALEMVLEGRVMYWVGKAWDALGMNARAIWLCLALGFNFGCRIGHVTLRRGKAKKKNPVLLDGVTTPKRDNPDHSLKCKHMKFYVKQVGSEALSIIRGGEEIRNFLKGNLKSHVTLVVFLEISFLTSKTVRKVTTNVVDVKKVGRSTPEEVVLLEDICEWMVKAMPKLEDELTCRYAKRNNAKGTIDRKVITAGEVNLGIKGLAVSLKLPPEMFSSRSLRSGLATHLTAQGVPKELRNQVGGWTKTSRVVDNHYAHRAAVGGTMSNDLEGPGIWSLDSVRHMVRQRKGL